MTNTQSFAAMEMDVLSKAATDPENRPLIEPFRNEILALCEAFGKSGQSGGSYQIVACAIADAAKKLMMQNPISPITGIDEEWVNVRDMSQEDEMMYQNKRCMGLFKSKSGKCWYVDAIAKKTPDGATWSGAFWLNRDAWLAGDKSKRIGHAHYVKSFPFTPKTFYIDVTEEEVAPDDWEMYLVDPKQLEKVFKYYDKRELK